MNLLPLLRNLPVLVLGLTGLGFAFAGSNYRVGSLTSMGPGFMPLMLGVFLAVLAFLLYRSERKDTIVLPVLPLRPVLCVSAGILVWTLLADAWGFFPAALVQLVLSALAVSGHQWSKLLTGSVLFSIATYGVFVILLGLPLAAFGG